METSIPYSFKIIKPIETKSLSIVTRPAEKHSILRFIGCEGSKGDPSPGHPSKGCHVRVLQLSYVTCWGEASLLCADR
jgi:hypothetical protein